LSLCPLFISFLSLLDLDPSKGEEKGKGGQRLVLKAKLSEFLEADSFPLPTLVTNPTSPRQHQYAGQGLRKRYIKLMQKA